MLCRRTLSVLLLHAGLYMFVMGMRTADGSDVQRYTEYNHNTSRVFHASFPTPMANYMFMEKLNTMGFQLLIECNSRQENISLSIKIDDVRIAKLISNTQINLTCINATFGNTTDVTFMNSTQYPIQYNIFDVPKLLLNALIEVDIYGEIIGKTFIHISLDRTSHGDIETGYTPNSETNTKNEDDLNSGTSSKIMLVVVRIPRPIDVIFRVVITVFLITVTLGFGCKLDIDVVKKSLKKPIAVSIGLGCQYLIMPLVSTWFP